METPSVEVVEPSQGEGQVAELSGEEQEKKEAAQIAEAHAVIIKNAKQPYLAVGEEATLHSIRFVKNFFAQIEPLTYKNYKGCIAWETIGLALRFFMGDVRFLHKEDARRARCKRKYLGFGATRLTMESEFTQELCLLLAQWVVCISKVLVLQRIGTCSYAIGDFSEQKREEIFATSLSNARSIQLLLCMAEHCQERERAKAIDEHTHP